MAFTRSRVRAPYPPPHNLADNNEREPNNSRSFCVQSLADSDTYNGVELGTEVGGSDKSATSSEQVQDADLRSEKALCRHKDSGEALPPGLTKVVSAWPDLPEAIKAGIVAMVEASCGE